MILFKKDTTWICWLVIDCVHVYCLRSTRVTIKRWAGRSMFWIFLAKMDLDLQKDTLRGLNAKYIALQLGFTFSIPNLQMNPQWSNDPLWVCCTMPRDSTSRCVDALIGSPLTQRDCFCCSSSSSRQSSPTGETSSLCTWINNHG